MTLKRSPLKRRTPLLASKPLSTKTTPKRSTPINPVNRERSAEKRDRNFGDEADRVRAMECACTKRLRDDWMLGKADRSMACSGKVEAAHVVARGGGGAKGDRWRLVPLCTKHHREAGEAPRPGTDGDAGTQRQAFEARYGLRLFDLADALALEHQRPLGIRGLADRWAWDGSCCASWLGASVCLDCGKAIEPPDLADHERDALLGWVHREMVRELRRVRLAMERFAARGSVSGDCSVDAEPEWLSRAVSNVLAIDPRIARSLCESAVNRFGGWPS